MAGVELSWAIDCFRDYQRSSQWRILQHHADGGRKCIWKQESGCGDGHDCVGLGWRVLDGSFYLSFVKAEHQL